MSHSPGTSIVGRTGSGKVSERFGTGDHRLTIFQSSLTLSLLRCIITEGKVYYDGVATDTINLDALRSNITIIPQVVCITQSDPGHALLTTSIRSAGATERHFTPKSGSFRTA